MPGPRLPLGVRPRVAYASRTAQVAADESLLLLTDGLPEARGAEAVEVSRLGVDEIAGGSAPDWHQATTLGRPRDSRAPPQPTTTLTSRPGTTTTFLTSLPAMNP